MWLMLNQKSADDYVIATNESHTVREFLEIAFDIVGLDWQEHVVIDDRFKRPVDVNYLKGDFSKANKELGWKPKIRFKNLVKIMVNEDLKKWNKWINGETFPWDAPNYPHEKRFFLKKII